MIKLYKETTYYISAYAKLSSGMPSGEIYKVLDIGFIIDMKSGIVEDMSVTLVTEETRSFIKGIVKGYNMNDGIEKLIEDVKQRYHGASQKAICVVIKQIHEKYLLIK